MSCGAICNCGCCAGVAVTTPETIYNRPGLDSILYRIGEHGSFLETMLARLSSSDFPALAGLTTRSPDDPSIALLDAWATVADVLTFYQERIANEGYLRTATERRSVRELARLIGYTPRPGVSASVYLAYTVDDNAVAPVLIPTGSRAQSVPDPGELPQSFETSDDFTARREWNAIKPRVHRPQTPQSIIEGSDENPDPGVYLKGISLNLKVNDVLLLQFGTARPAPFRAAAIEENTLAGYTFVKIAFWSGAPLLASAAAQLRRALQRVKASEDNLGSGTGTVSTDLLLIAADFLSWLYGQATSDSPPADVELVLDQPDLIANIVAVFDQIRETAIAPLSDAQLTLALGALTGALANLSAASAELSVNRLGATIGARVDAVVAAVKALSAKGGNNDLETTQDQRLEALMRRIVGQLAITPSVPPRDSQSLERSAASLFDAHSDVGTRAVAALQPSLAASIEAATRNAQAAPPNPMRVFVLRQKALLFGAPAPPKVTSVGQNGVARTDEWTDTDMVLFEEPGAVYLDSSYDKIKPGSWIMLDFSAIPENADLGGIKLRSRGVLLAQAGSVSGKIARAAYGFNGQTTRVTLVDSGGSAIDWFDNSAAASPLAPAAVAVPPVTHPAFIAIRRTSVYFETEELALGEEAMAQPICGGDDWIECDRLLSGLDSGRWLVVSGDRADTSGTSGVAASELVMLEAVRNYVAKAQQTFSLSGTQFARAGGALPIKMPGFLPGDTLHTFIKLARPLNYCYKRDTVSINANVVKATNGETRKEICGSGDSSQELQTFTLRQPPLTWVPSPQPSGVAETLRVYVNNVEWHAADSLTAMGPNDRSFLMATDDDQVTSITFGNGVNGARLPTGTNNVNAIYRSGIGRGGNVKINQISQLMSRPLGVKGVFNPVGASGGADPESRDQARENAPLAVKSLDRLVSTGDYADFARTFAGIGKAVSARLSENGVEGVFLTVAGVDDIPIDKTGDLYQNLVKALAEFGDPWEPFRVDIREQMLLAVSARIAIDPDYLWPDVSDRVRAALVSRFSFEQRDLGKGIALSEVIAVMQNVKGVVWLDVDALGAVSQIDDAGELRSPQEISKALAAIFTASLKRGAPAQQVMVRGIRKPKDKVLPAQIAFFTASLPETIILNQLKA